MDNVAIVVFACALAIPLAVGVIGIVAFCFVEHYKRLAKCCKDGYICCEAGENEYPSEKTDRTTCTGCRDFIWMLYHRCILDNVKKLHSPLSALFPDLLSKSLQISSRESKSHDVKDGKVYTLEHKTDVLLFDFKEFEEGMDKGKIRDLLHGWTYCYFILVAILAVIWGVVITLEHAINTKTGTCDDASILNNSFACYDVATLQQRTCQLGSANASNEEVICYQFNPTTSSLGIAFGGFKLIFFAVTNYFKIAVKVAEYPWGKYVLITVQVLLFVATGALLIALPAMHYLQKAEMGAYFLHGHVAVRVAMLILLVITPAVIIPVPWCGFTSTNKQRNTVLVVDPNLQYELPPTNEAGVEQSLKKYPLNDGQTPGYQSIDDTDTRGLLDESQL